MNLSECGIWNFSDTDGTGYLLIHEGDIYRLSEDYHSAEKRLVKNMAPGGESPAMFKKKGIYYFLFSNKTSWEKMIITISQLRQ